MALELLPALTALLASTQWIEPPQRQSRFVDAERAIAFDLPFAMAPVPNPVERFDPAMVAVREGRGLRLVVSSYGPETVDSAYVADLTRLVRRSESVVPNFRSLVDPQIRTLGERRYAYAEHLLVYGDGVRFLAWSFTSNDSAGLIVKYFALPGDSDRAREALLLAQRTLLLGRPARQQAARPADIWPSMPFFREHLAALESTYTRFAWDSAALEAVVQRVRASFALPVDFDAPPRSLDSLARRRPGRVWRRYLDVFFWGNANRWLPSDYKRLSHGDTMNARVTTFWDSLKTTPLELRRWRTLQFATPDGAAVMRFHSDAGSARPLGDIMARSRLDAGDIALRTVEPPPSTGAEYLHRLAPRMLGFDPALDFADYTSSDEGFAVALAAITAFHDVVTRREAPRNVLGTSSRPPPAFDVYVYRDRASYAQGVRAAGGASLHGRSAAVLTPGALSIHVVMEHDTASAMALLQEDVFRRGQLAALASDSLMRRTWDDAVMTWSLRAQDISSAVSHELDHVIMAREAPGRPAWFIEGQATHYGELLQALNLLGVAVGSGTRGPVLGTLGDTVRGIADTVLRLLSPIDDLRRTRPAVHDMAALLARYDLVVTRALRASALISPRAQYYEQLLRRRPVDSLVTDMRRLAVSPDEAFQEPSRLEFNYALAWGMARAANQAEQTGNAEWRLRHRARWLVLTGTSFSRTREQVFGGRYDSLFRWLGGQIHAWHPEATP